MSDKIPCRFCDERAVGCHGKCEQYKEFRIRLDQKNQRRREERMLSKDADDFMYEGYEKRNKKYRKKR